MSESEADKGSMAYLSEKADWVRRETLRIHKTAPGIRLASSLSCVEILVALHYGGVLRFFPVDRYSEERDRFIVSKAHGSVSYYPILADFGYFPMEQLRKVGKAGSILGDIPDNSIPGYETVNGSLGYGVGVACGHALALKAKGSQRNVLVLLGDGELFEGSVWEAIMFAAQHCLDNLTVIIDNNKICMLDYSSRIIDLNPLHKKFDCFGWEHFSVDGHDVEALAVELLKARDTRTGKPKVVIADTVKGKGVPKLEGDSLCHIRALKPEEIDSLLEETDR
jgi:transketolase